MPLTVLTKIVNCFIFTGFAFLRPAGPFVGKLVSFLAPSLVFTRLLLAFYGVRPGRLIPEM